MNPFATLGIKDNASLQDAKEAYRRLAMKFHPDRVPAKEKAAAEEQFKNIKQAFELIEGGYTEPVKDPKPKSEPEPKPQAQQSQTFKTRAEATQKFYTYSGVDTTEDTTILAYKNLDNDDYEAFVPLSAAAAGFVLETKILTTAYRVKIPAGIPNNTIIEVGPAGRQVRVQIKFKSSTLKTIMAEDASTAMVNGDEILNSGIQIAEITISSRDHQNGTTVRLATSFGESVMVRIPKFHSLQHPIILQGKGYFNWNRTKKRAEARNNLYVYVSIKDPQYVQATQINGARSLW